MERLRGKLIVVADDGGLHPAIERGIKVAAENGALSCVDYMIERQGVSSAALSLRREFSHINIGLHVEIAQINDYAMTAIAYWGRWRPDNGFQKRVLQATGNQIKKFQDIFGDSPAHLSTHGHVHMDHHDKPFPWFTDFLKELLGDETSEILVRGINTIPIRHTRAREIMRGRNPLTPSQFKGMLLKISAAPNKPIELIIHPARGINPSDPPFRAIYTLTARGRDLDALIRIINSGVIEEAGYKIVVDSEDNK